MTRPTARRGLAMVMAIVLLGLTAVIVTVVVAQASGEQRRTLSAGDDAQASQLLAAGVRAAEAAASGPADGMGDGVVPTPVGRVTLTWGGDRRTCVVDATAGTARRAVTVTFAGAKAVRIEE